MAESTMQFGYWKIRGLAAPIRMLLAYAGQPYEEVAYEQGDGPHFDSSCWRDKKHKLGFPLPNLPYLIDGEVQMSQSGAIIRHLARKLGFAGNGEKEQALVDMVAEEVVDVRRSYMFVYSPNYVECRDAFVAKLPNLLGGLEEYLSGDWLVGASPTYADFMAAEVIDTIGQMVPGSLDDYPKLKALRDRVMTSPRLEEYQKGAGAWPINNKVAYFGGGWREKVAQE